MEFDPVGRHTGLPVDEVEEPHACDLNRQWLIREDPGVLRKAWAATVSRDSGWDLEPPQLGNGSRLRDRVDLDGGRIRQGLDGPALGAAVEVALLGRGCDWRLEGRQKKRCGDATSDPDNGDAQPNLERLRRPNRRETYRRLLPVVRVPQESPARNCLAEIPSPRGMMPYREVGRRDRLATN
jgi:hypothetical protein